METRDKKMAFWKLIRLGSLLNIIGIYGLNWEVINRIYGKQVIDDLSNNLLIQCLVGITLLLFCVVAGGYFYYIYWYANKVNLLSKEVLTKIKKEQDMTIMIDLYFLTIIPTGFISIWLVVVLIWMSAYFKVSMLIGILLSVVLFIYFIILQIVSWKKIKKINEDNISPKLD